MRAEPACPSAKICKSIKFLLTRAILRNFLFANKEAVKLNSNISKIKIQALFGYGALPHRPTKGLSDRPLETFGRNYLVLFLKYRCC